MIDWHAIIGKCNQSVDVRCQKLSLSLLLICLFLYQFGEALKKMVPARKKNGGNSCTGPLIDIGTSQDELWDKTRSLFGILEGDISIFRKVIIWKILR
jgi:hypothetical protein